MFGLCAAFHSSAQSARPPTEPLLRAAVVGGILKYTIWEAVQPPSTVCTVGHPSSEQPLLKAGADLAIGSTALKVVPLQSRDYTNLPRCSAVVVGKLSKTELAGLQRHMQWQDILTICDGCQDHAIPANIVLLKANQRIAFLVMLREQAKIRFRSDLLELAAEVRWVDGGATSYE